ncbi:MAG: TetR/AcrR family transcriptional regulator [Solirubrobacterales bacterium]|nr:TetR/AcrR family transcriptional regulator [Solirubrobacterales bacterium]
MSHETRPYRKRRRAEAEEATRRRITESAVALHGTRGPSRTSMSAVAEHAGVQRSTLYRHFPDEGALLDACTAHWAAANPLPDLETWAAVAEPDARLRTALTEMYAFYGRNEQMLGNLLRDEPAMPLVQQHFRPFREYLQAARDVLLAGRRMRGEARERTAAAIGHALSFPTWRSLVREQGLDQAQAVALLCRLVAAAGGRD